MRWARGLALATLLPLVVQAQEPPPVASLGWLAGCWKAERGEAGSEEHWLAPAGGTMLGMARTVRGGRTVEHEFMQIRVDGQGRLVFIARPSGQAEGTFPLAQAGEGLLVFENPAHDFPQRVIYRLASPGRLAARIEGVRNGQARGVDFPMTRC